MTLAQYELSLCSDADHASRSPSELGGSITATSEHGAAAFSYTPPHVRGSETSKAAAEQIKGAVPSLQSLVFAAIRRAKFSGLTDIEGCAELDMQGSTWRPRRVELVDKGWVIDSGGVRRSPSGRNCVVWVAAEFKDGDR